VRILAPIPGEFTANLLKWIALKLIRRATNMTRWTTAILKKLNRTRSTSRRSRPSKAISFEVLESREVPATLNPNLNVNALALSEAPVQAQIFRMLMIAGPIDLSQSTLSISKSLIVSGSTAIVTLKAFDTSGLPLTSGGADVEFITGAGAGDGTFGTVTDHGNGTYTAVFTATTAGTNTILAQVNGDFLVQEVAFTVTTGAISPARSTVTVALASIQSGATSTVTLTARDANNNLIGVGGATVTFGLGSGTGQGTFSAVTDNGDGTYTATFTGTTAGTNTITATINTQAVTSTAPTITIIGALDPAQSTVTLTPASILPGATSTVTLTARDSNGAQLLVGGATVVFGLGNGVGQGTFGTVTDNNNGTYTVVFTGTTVGANTVTATINGQAVTTTAPTITVVGTPDPAQSTVTLNPASVQSGATSTVTLTARDSNGVQVITGGATVVFSLGAGAAQGTFGTVTDNNNGTYTAVFTATTAGTNTVTATINGQAVTTTAPTITVVGAADLGQSDVVVNPTTIQNGDTTTLTLTARDLNGNQLTTGGLAVLFALGNGTAQGTFGTVTDNGNGTYSSTFTATVVGTNTVTATINGQTLTSTAPTITVVQAASPAQSTVGVNPASIQSGSTSTVTLTANDASGNPVTVGGSVVTFGLGAGTAQGTFGTVTDNGDGTYTAVFTGTTAGTNTVTATIDGQAVTTTAPTITVTPGNADLAQTIVALNPTSILSGGTSTVTLTVRDANGNQLAAGGAAVVFGLGAGTAQGTFGTVTDNLDGTYTAVFTGTTAGTNTVTATFDGQAVTSTAPTITVTPGAADPAQTLVSINPATIASGDTSTVTLTAIDANGNQLAAGGSTVGFGLGVGTGAGNFAAVVDNGDGTYTSIFTGTTVGTNTVTATIDTIAVTSTAPTFTVT
jgi:adhesin/invasin